MAQVDHACGYLVSPLQSLHRGEVPPTVLSGEGLVLLVDPGVSLITQVLETKDTKRKRDQILRLVHAIKKDHTPNLLSNIIKSV
jgi:hypothetical protein